MTIESTLERIAIALETLASAPVTGLPPKTETTDAPKATRQRKTSTAAAPSTAEAVTPAVEKAEPAAAVSSSDPETDDLFGEETPAVEETKVVKVTIEQVKAALVSVQTALKHKDHAIAILKKHTMPKGEAVLSKLPESAYAALIAEAAASVKAGKVS
jgi:hypothetical protein